MVEFGGNDVRDALSLFASGGDGGLVIAEALASIGENIGALYAAGARKFLVWTAPNLGMTPAIRALDGVSPGAASLAGMLTDTFNTGVDVLVESLSTLPGIEILLFDVNKKFNDLLADPAAFGLTAVDAACITPGVPPFACRTPDEFLFWDGIHPTGAVHAIIAEEVLAVTR